MPTSSLPLDIKNFLIECIDSVSHLEVLLMLYAEPKRSWNALAISREMRSNMTSASNHLEDLFKKGFLAQDSEKHFHYHPTSKELEEKVKLLSDIYHEKPVAVITAIFERPNDKLKGFADAFKLKKD